MKCPLYLENYYSNIYDYFRKILVNKLNFFERISKDVSQNKLLYFNITHKILICFYKEEIWHLFVLFEKPATGSRENSATKQLEAVSSRY